MPTHWILQANPDHYNLDGRLQLKGPALFWTIRQHAANVTEGDIAWIWRARGKAGRTAGIAAKARIGAWGQEEEPDPFQLGEPSTADGPEVEILVDEVLPPGATLRRDDLKLVPALSQLAVIVRPQGTVFPVTPDEATELERLFADALHRAPPFPQLDLPTGLDVGPLQRHADEAAFRDPGFWTHMDRRVTARSQALPEIRDLVRRFLNGALDVQGLREEFDGRTRSMPWSAFGFGGQSGGMALNKLVKHYPDTQRLEESLRAAFRVPSDEAGAERRIDELEALLEAAIEAGQVTRGQLQPARLPFLLSALWHVQDQELWPVRYDSVRQWLLRCGLQLPDSLGRGYMVFRGAVLAARAALRLPVQVFDLVCAHVVADGGAEAPEPPRRRRVWTIGIGHEDKARYWTWFRTAGLFAMGGGIGDLAEYPDREAMLEALKPLPWTSNNPTGDALGLWRFLTEVRPGDRIIAREGRSMVLGVGEVTGEYRSEPDSPYEYIRDARWDWTGRLELPDKPFAIHTLVDITKREDLVAWIEAGIAETGAPGDDPPTRPPSYGVDDALADLFMDRSELEAHLARLRRRRNLVLQGPPGTGKTFVAARLARLLTGDATDSRVRRVQFHQSYTYEHFVQGFRATEQGGFRLEDGPFKRLCDQARDRSEQDFVLIVDEINRGNLGRIFGELLMLIEGDKRSPEWAVELAYSGEPFWVPPNVYLVGTMNTADRSLALVDYALRRRFAFTTIAPAWSRTQLRDHLVAEVGEAGLVDRMIAAMRGLNQQVGQDRDLGPGFRVGHSWFCHGPEEGEAPEAWWADIVETEIEPLLAEYWFDRSEALEEASTRLRWDGE